MAAQAATLMPAPPARRAGPDRADAATDELRIVGVDVARCTYPLRHPLRFGPARYAVREYVALRVRTDAGPAGFACGHARETPLFAALKPLSDRVVGHEALRGRQLMARLLASNVPGRAALVRAHSLVELALWDVTAKVAGLPLHLLLGGLRGRVPALAVAGYLIDQRGEDAVVAELLALEAQGFRQLKLMLEARDPTWMRRFLGRCREALGPQTQLGLDVHYSFPDLAEATRVCRALDELELAFIEDPFPPAQWRHYRALAATVRTPLAAGEDVTDPLAYRDLLESVRLLRVDPTTCGGLTAALRGIDLAAAAGARVLGHGFPWLDAQVAGASGEIDWVEVVAPPANGDRFGDLLDGVLHVEDGEVVLDRRPGTGMHLAWDRVRADASELWSTGGEAR